MRVRALALAALLGSLVGCASFHRGPLPGEPPTATFARLEGARIRYVDAGQ
ncbi:MAG: hypothetical protein FJ096_11110, partial [Deltaproteobacteria bacterium]|nr:hypothetical protein [Deltaproteobacteria bacterium]